jgi:acetate kinase
MADQLLTLNAGSSSIKYALFERQPAGLARLNAGQVEGIGTPGGPASHGDALGQVLATIGGAHITAVGHRIVHGGTGFDHPVAIDEAVLAQIDALAPLAPLHQPHNAAGVRAAQAAFAGVPQVACFDTAFHRSMPPLNQRFALPAALHDAGVRRYGFHGLSYESIAAQVAALGTAPDARVVVAHLGNGASMCAMRGGRSVATTMSFSPLDGLPMGTRCGRLDAAVVLHLLGQGHSSADVTRLLYRESGLLGLSGLSSDMRTLMASALPEARMAVDYFVEYVARELAGMAAALRGIDLLVFTGGIGENAAELRNRIIDAAAWLGLQRASAPPAADPGLLSSTSSPVQVRVLRTDEEAVIAHHTARLAWGTAAA